MTGTNRRIRYLPETSTPLLLFFLFWVLVPALPVLLFTGELARVQLFSAGSLHRMVFAVQLSYVILALPLLLSCRDVLEAGPVEEESSSGARLLRYLMFVGGLLALGGPILLVAAEIADAARSYLVQSQVQLAAFVSGIGLIWWGAGRTRRDWVPPLFVGLMVLTVFGPLCYAGIAQIAGNQFPVFLDLSPVVSAFRDETVFGVNPRMFHAGMAMVVSLLISTAFLLGWVPECRPCGDDRG